MITELRQGESHIQFFDSEAPKDENCIGTVRVRFADAFRKAVQEQLAATHANANDNDQTQDN